MKTTYVLLILTTIFFSCSRYIPISTQSLSRYHLEGDKIKRVQLFLSRNVSLQSGKKNPIARDLDEKGKVIESSEAFFNEILIKKHTEGVCVSRTSEGHINVSFDPEDDTKFLTFGDTKNIGRYYLLADKWAAGRGKIKYGNSYYYVNSSAAYTYINFKYKRKEKYNKKSTVVKGRQVN